MIRRNCLIYLIRIWNKSFIKNRLHKAHSIVILSSSVIQETGREVRLLVVVAILNRSLQISFTALRIAVVV